MNCEVCGSVSFHAGTVGETFLAAGKMILVEGIPATICDRCSSPSFSAVVAEQLRKLVHGPHTVVRVVEAEVLDFHAA
ncbi:MAG: YgiT-type zinc finger protein [Planctomycetes bacterium]|nr:YgiT-type zinc finger protein [Planctomycetota bacterium]